jgi:cytoskeletal protein CcmA (bactofilin family)
MATNKEIAAGAAGSTVIGPSITINGKLSGDEDLTVRGRLEGEVTLTKTLILEVSGIVKANVSVKNAVISGVVVGNVRATESVELTKEGRMVGDIAAPRVILVDGASFRGRIEMGEAAVGRAAGDRVGRPTRVTERPSTPPRPPPPPRAEARGMANSRTTVTPILSKLESKSPPLPPALAGAGRKRVVVRKRER